MAAAAWEYRVEKIGGGIRSAKPEALAELLNQAAAEGWEPLQVTPASSTYQLLVIFRRAVTRETRRRATWPDMGG